MLQLVLSRAIHALPVVWGVVTIVFVLTHLSGDPVQLLLPDVATDAEIAAMRQRLGYDQPLVNQYLIYLRQVAGGDFGTSIRFNQPALDLVLARFPATALLAVVAMSVAALVAIPAGIVAARRPGSIVDRAVTAFTLFGYAVPPFWLGLMLILVFSVGLRLVPPSGSGTWQQLILPSITLGLPAAALLARLLRRGLIDAYGQDYIRTARAKGLPESRVLSPHAIKNAALPVITVFGLEIAALLSGAVITETVYSYPGVGQLVVQAINQRDFAIVQAFVVTSAVVIVVVNLLVDMTYHLIDPRIADDRD